jgi:hypothetical protein
MIRIIMSVLLLAGISARPAHGYPQFQLSTGASRCGQCHVGPAGGGLLTGYGRDTLTDAIARTGNGDLLHGAWSPPSWLLLGGDLRGATALVHDGSETSPEALAFLMQAELTTQLRAGAFSGLVALGARGTARGQTTQALDRLGSREHYLMWRPATQGPYVRAGRFMLPYGLRLAQHPSYVRRFGGSNTEEEPLALSGGWANDGDELHATLFTSAPLRCTGLGCAKAGAAVLYERRVWDRSAWGAQARAAMFAERFGHGQAGAGGIGKHVFGRVPVMLLAELDYEARFLSEAGVTSHQILAHLGATWFATRGLLVSASAEAFAADLATFAASRAAGSAEVQFFPWAHVELIGYARLTDRGSALAMMMLHYTL